MGALQSRIMSNPNTTTIESIAYEAHQINQFGITGQGFQNPISDHLQPIPKEPKNQRVPDITDPDFAETLPLPVTDCFNDSIYSNKGNDGKLQNSYSKLTTIQKKHIRHPKNPNELYDVPLTDNQKYGWHQPKEVSLKRRSARPRKPRKDRGTRM